MDYDAKLNQFSDAEEFYNVNLLSLREREREREIFQKPWQTNV